MRGDVHPEQPLLFTVLLPDRPQIRKMRRQRLNGANNGRRLNLFLQAFKRVITARNGYRQIAKAVLSKNDLAARIYAVFLMAKLFASFGDEIKGGLAVEDAGLAALGLDHVQDLFHALDLVESALGPDA